MEKVQTISPLNGQCKSISHAFITEEKSAAMMFSRLVDAIFPWNFEQISSGGFLQWAYPEKSNKKKINYHTFIEFNIPADSQIRKPYITGYPQKFRSVIRCILRNFSTLLCTSIHVSPLCNQINPSVHTWCMSLSPGQCENTLKQTSQQTWVVDTMLI